MSVPKLWCYLAKMFRHTPRRVSVVWFFVFQLPSVGRCGWLRCCGLDLDDGGALSGCVVLESSKLHLHVSCARCRDEVATSLVLWRTLPILARMQHKALFVGLAKTVVLRIFRRL